MKNLLSHWIFLSDFITSSLRNFGLFSYLCSVKVQKKNGIDFFGIDESEYGLALLVRKWWVITNQYIANVECACLLMIAVSFQMRKAVWTLDWRERNCILATGMRYSCLDLSGIIVINYEKLFYIYFSFVVYICIFQGSRFQNVCSDSTYGLEFVGLLRAYCYRSGSKS